MLTLVHLSDIHFRDRDHQTQFDLYQQIRSALIEDLQSKPSGAASYDGLFVGGDIAFGGAKLDYVRAQDFLDEVFATTGISQSRTYIVPGNHDVDRSFVDPTFPLWDSHQRIRNTLNEAERHDIVYKQLLKDPLHTLLKPLSNYNDFAQGYDCLTTETQLAWSHVFDTRLEQEVKLRLHGLNSALVSDAADAPAKLLLTEYQISQLRRAPDTVELMLCHHPPDWLIDKAQLRNALDSYISIGLFGHEHSTRISATSTRVDLFAGAVQPSDRDPEWLPTYHILQLSVEGIGMQRHLVVRIHTREFHKAKGHKFLPRVNGQGKLVDEYRISFPSGSHTPENGMHSSPVGAAVADVQVDSGMAGSEPEMPTPVEIAQRELLGHFFRLGTPSRFAAAIEAGLVRNGDDTMEPRQMWSEVFTRAVAESRLEKFWTAVASRSPALRDRPNPFSR